ELLPTLPPPSPPVGAVNRDRDSASRETETAFRPNRTCSQLQPLTRALDGRPRLESHHAHPPRSLRPLLLDITWASWAMGDARGVVVIRIHYRYRTCSGWAGPRSNRFLATNSNAGRNVDGRGIRPQVYAISGADNGSMPWTRYHRGDIASYRLWY
ncbi:hypothetical protein THAOC_15321, partial [Thalassiosira oceanica]